MMNQDQHALPASTPAGLLPRACAYIVDALILSALIAAFGFHRFVFLGYWLLIVVLEGSKYAASPGKLIMGLSCQYEQGTARAVSACIRNVVKICSHFFMLGFLISIIDRRRRTLHDRLAHSVVLNRPDIELPSGRRAFAFVLIVTGVIAATGMNVYYRLSPYFLNNSMAGFLSSLGSSQLSENEATQILEKQLGTKLGSDLKVVWSMQEFSQMGLITKILTCDRALNLNPGSKNFDQLINEIPATGAVLFYVGDLGASMQMINAELAKFSGGSETVFYEIAGQQITSSRYRFEKGSERWLAHRIRLNDQLVMLTMGEQDAFDVYRYLTIVLR